ncbi:MAG: hypothetical protein ACRCZM_08365 [Bacteroidales bacterium]
MKRIALAIVALTTLCGISASNMSSNISNMIYLKRPGNVSDLFDLHEDEEGVLYCKSRSLPLSINQKTTESDGRLLITTTLKANEDVWLNFQQLYQFAGVNHDDCLFYMPGFWYRKNLRSPKEAPSFHTSQDWRVREDRLSVPLTGIYSEKSGEYCSVIRVDDFQSDALSALKSGEAILDNRTSIGYTGFESHDGISTLAFGYPAHEAPKSYVRKLTLDPESMMFQHLKAGESRTLVWEVMQGKATDYAKFVEEVWNYSYDKLSPTKLEGQYTADEAKSILSNFFVESYVSTDDLNYYSGVHMRTDDCNSTGSVEVGFVGRVLLNAFNALEYGESLNRSDLVENANSIFDSYLKKGFTPNGLFREFVDYTHNTEPAEYSIRRQSEGVFAMLHYLNYQKQRGGVNKEWESKIKLVLDNFIKLQNADGSFPRKFDDKLSLIDPTGGSTPSATLPLVMAYKYFNDKKYLEAAKRTGEYLERALISKSDYFSSTLDANCEDKEASLYAATATYYLALATKGEERKHYTELTRKASYFAMSWYYMWDVPFAKGQMLGDVNFKSRGWGNVSVENNHIDVFIFEFADVIEWLSKEYNDPRFYHFSEIIKSSMLQLMPTQNSRFDIAKVGYYPEVVQHTNWDYGKNGKGFYNDIFAPGWTVASLWELLTPRRAEKFLLPKKK